MTRSLSWFSAIHGSPLARLVVFGQAVRSLGSFHGPGVFSIPGGGGIGFGHGSPARAGKARRTSGRGRKATGSYRRENGMIGERSGVRRPMLSSSGGGRRTARLFNRR